MGMHIPFASWTNPVTVQQRPMQATPAVQNNWPVLFGGQSIRNKVEAHYPVIVVGGGMAGLTAMYELVKKSHIPALLMEAKKRLGGNTNTGVSPQGVPHTAGATIFLPGNKNHQKLWKELGLEFKPEYRLKPEIFIYQGERFTAFGSPDELAEFAPKQGAHKKIVASFQRFLDWLHKTFQDESKGPAFPIQDASKKSLRLFDDRSFKDITKPFGKGVQALLEPYIQSDLAAASEDVSAYVGMMDIEDLNNDRFVFPSGNSYVINRFKEEIQNNAPDGSNPIQLQHVVEHVEQDKNKVYVQYRDANKKLHVVSADSVLMAAPYHEVPRIMSLPKKVKTTMQAVPKSSYNVVNIYLNRSPLQVHQFYALPESKLIADLYMTTNNPSADHKPKPEEPSVLCIYTPHKGLIRNKQKFEEKVKAEIFKNFPEITPDMVTGVRLNTFQYSMAAPEPGQVRDLKEMPRTFGRVTMIHSDGGAVPSLLSAIDEAQLGVKVAKTQINKDA